MKFVIFTVVLLLLFGFELADSQNQLNVTVNPISTVASLTLKKKKPITKSKVRLQFVQRNNQDSIEHPTFVGSNFKLDCRVKTVDDSPLVPPKMTWLKDNVPLQSISYRIFPSQGLEDIYVIELKNLLAADSGKYKCTADNFYNKQISYTISLKVNEKKYDDTPQFQEFGPINPVIEVGKKVSFNCKAKKVKDHTALIQWVKYSSRKIVEKSTIKTNSSSLNNTVSTTVPVLNDPSLPNTPDTNEVDDGVLSGNILSLDRAANVSYIENGMIFEKMTLKIEQTDESDIVIGSVKFEDAGDYVCFIFNHNGYVKNISKLVVTPVPPLSADELEERYISLYGHKYDIKYPLSILIGLPLFLMVILIIGCVWWNEKQKSQLKEGEIVAHSKNQSYVPEEKKQLIIPEVFIIPDSGSEQDRLHGLHCEKDSPHASEHSLQLEHP